MAGWAYKSSYILVAFALVFISSGASTQKIVPTQQVVPSYLIQGDKHVRVNLPVWHTLPLVECVAVRRSIRGAYLFLEFTCEVEGGALIAFNRHLGYNL